MSKRTAGILTALLSVFLLVYVGYQVYQTVYSPIKTETVYRYSTYQTVDTEGVTVRDEKIISGTPDGYVNYLAENGTRVSKKGVIAEVYPSEQDALAQTMIDRLQSEIEALKTVESQKASNVNLTLMTKQLKNTVLSTVKSVHTDRFSDLYTLRSNLAASLNKQAITVGTASDFNDYIAILESRLNAYRASARQATKTISSPVSGYFVGHVDGYETILTPDLLTNLNPSTVHDALAAKPVPTDGIGKVVGDYEWYLLCTVSASDALALTSGMDVSIRLPFVSQEAIPMTVKTITREASGDMTLVLSCSYMSKELSSLRRETVQILVKEYTGLRVPKSAMVFDNANQPGVYVRVGNTISFRRAEVLYSTSDYCICAEQEGNKKFLQLYDDIVMEGRDLYDGKIVK